MERKPGWATLDRPSTSAAEVGSRDAQATALATKPASTSHRHQSHRNRPGIGCAGPNQGNKPAHDGPTEKEVHHKDQSGVRFVAPYD